MARVWRACSMCKKPISVGARYYSCSVSTCNRVRDPKVFCTLACWDAHVPIMSHRASVWADEQVAPTSLESAPAPAEEPEGRRRIARTNDSTPDTQEVLVIASRLKDFIQKQSDFQTSADVMEVLSDHLRLLALEGIERAREDGRRTVKARDIRRPGS